MKEEKTKDDKHFNIRYLNKEEKMSEDKHYNTRYFKEDKFFNNVKNFIFNTETLKPRLFQIFF